MVKIMPVGDSITFGVVDFQANNERSGGYRTVLSELLVSSGFINPGDFDFVGSRSQADTFNDAPNSLIDKDHEGHRAWTIDDIRIGRPNQPAEGNINIWLTEQTPDIVLLMTGTNDLSPALQVGAPDRLSALIDQITAFSATLQVLVATIPPRPTNLQAATTYNDALRNTVVPQKIAQGKQVTLVDIANTLTVADISADTIHPTLLGYTKIANAWYNALLPIIDPDIDKKTAATRETQIQPTRIEAEAMALTTFAVEATTVPEAPQVISLLNSFNTIGAVAATGTASTTFAPPAPGRYDVVLGYFDENDAVAQLQVTVGNNVLPEFDLDQDLGTGVITFQNVVRRTVGQGILINEATPITITGTSAFPQPNAGELVRVDYIEFVPVNDAPVLNATSVQNLTPIAQNSTTNNGDLVSSILGAAVQDIDTQPLLGIAVTGADNTNGIWQYSIDNGTNWAAFGNASSAEARLLVADDKTRIRFVPNNNYNGTPTGLTFRAWDRTRGTAGNTVDISTVDAVGGSTAFSAEIATATVSALNTPPIANADSATTLQNQTVSINVLSNDSDPDNNTLLIASFAATSLAGGIITRNDKGNTDPTDDEIFYTPANDFIGTDSFNYTLSDGSLTATGTVTVTVSADGTSPPPPLSLIHNPDDSFSITDFPGEAQLRFAIAQRNTSFVNEIGFFVVDDPQGTIDGIAPGAPGYLEAALGRGQVIFSVLPDGLGSTDATRQLSGFNGGDRLGFYLVQNSTTDAVLAGQTASVFFGSPSFNADGSDYLQVSALNNAGYTLAWKDQQGASNQNFDDVVMTVETISPSAPLPVGTQLQGSEQGELIDLKGLVSPVATFNYQIVSEAKYDNTVGLYLVEDQQGRVLDPVTGNLIAPGEAGYQVAAIQRSVLQSSLQSNRQAVGSLQLNSGVLLAPYIIADGTVDEFLAQNTNNQQGQSPYAYFAYLGANPNGVDHVRLLGDNTFGFEDLYGGGDRDYNDIVFNVDIAVA